MCPLSQLSLRIPFVNLVWAHLIFRVAAGNSARRITQINAETGGQAGRQAGSLVPAHPARGWTHSASHFPISFLRGYEVCATSGPAKLSQQLQDGRRQGHHRALLVLLTSRWAYGRCSKSTFGVPSPSLRMSTGAKHLHGDRPAYLSACERLTCFRPPAQTTSKEHEPRVKPCRACDRL